MSSNIYSDKTIYKFINLTNNNITLNTKTLITNDLKLDTNIVTSNNIKIKSSNLEILDRKLDYDIAPNKVVIYNNDGKIKATCVSLNQISFGKNTINFPEKKGNNGDFLSIDENGNFKWSNPSQAGINSLNSLSDVMVDETNIIFGLNDSTAWLPNNNNKVDIGSTTNKIKDIYCRRILCNDVDITSNIGRSSIGYCGKHDYATFSHYDSNNINSFAIGQTNFGETTINSSKNKNLYLSINNNPELIISPLGNVSIGSNYPIGKLTIEGTKNNNNIDNTNDFSIYSESNILTNGSLFLPSDKRLSIHNYKIDEEVGVNLIGKLKFSKNEKNNFTIEFPENDESTIKVQQFIPNIHELGRFLKNGKNNIIDLYQNFTVDGLLGYIDENNKKRYNKLKLKKSNGDTIIVNILKVSNDKRIFIDTDLTLHCDYKYIKNKPIYFDNTSTISNNYIFLYGQEVDDLNYYNQSQLSIINSMVVKRLLIINKSMEEEITNLKENNDKIIKRLDRLEGVLKSRDRINNKKNIE